LGREYVKEEGRKRKKGKKEARWGCKRVIRRWGVGGLEETEEGGKGGRAWRGVWRGTRKG